EREPLPGDASPPSEGAPATDEPRDDPATDDRIRGEGLAERAVERYAAAAAPIADAAREVYAVCAAEALPADVGGLHDGRATATIRRLVREVLDREAPVHVDLLCRRVADAFGARLTARARERILAVVDRLPAAERPNGRDGFLWLPGVEPAGWRRYRVPDAAVPDSQRDADEIPPEEVANAAAAVLGEQVALPREDLLRETSRRLGFLRLGARVDEAMRRGVELLIARGDAREDGGTIVG